MTRMLRDDSYQETLPYHARHTASTSIKSNTRLTQFIQNEDINTGKQMNYYALENYLYNKENSFEYHQIIEGIVYKFFDFLFLFPAYSPSPGSYESTGTKIFKKFDQKVSSIV